MRLMDDLESLSNRGYTEGFYRRHVPKDFQNYENGHSSSSRHQFVGEITSINDEHSLSFDVKNRFAVGDTMELMTPTGNMEFQLSHIQQERNGETLSVAPGSGHKIRIPVPENINLKQLYKSLLLRRLDNVINA